MTELTPHVTEEKESFPELIDLQSANVEVIERLGEPTKWNVRKNISGESLKVFEANITNDFMFSILNFAREFELKAFNIGIAHQKGKANVLLKDKIRILMGVNKELADENIRLATLLENLLSEN